MFFQHTNCFAVSVCEDLPEYILEEDMWRPSQYDSLPDEGFTSATGGLPYVEFQKYRI